MYDWDLIRLNECILCRDNSITFARCNGFGINISVEIYDDIKKINNIKTFSITNEIRNCSIHGIIIYPNTNELRICKYCRDILDNDEDLSTCINCRPISTFCCNVNSYFLNQFGKITCFRCFNEPNIDKYTLELNQKDWISGFKNLPPITKHRIRVIVFCLRKYNVPLELIDLIVGRFC